MKGVPTGLVNRRGVLWRSMFGRKSEILFYTCYICNAYQTYKSKQFEKVSRIWARSPGWKYKYGSQQI